MWSGAFRPDVAFVHNVYPLISPSAYHKLHALGVPDSAGASQFSSVLPERLFYTQGQICEACKGGNYLNAVRKRCYKDSYAFSGLYAMTLGLNRLAGMVDKISGIYLPDRILQDQDAGSRSARFQAVCAAEFCVCSTHCRRREESGNDTRLFMGRLSPEKGCWTLIHAFEKLPAGSVEDCWNRANGTGVAGLHPRQGNSKYRDSWALRVATRNGQCCATRFAWCCRRSGTRISR